MYVDTHTHLHDLAYNPDGGIEGSVEAVRRAIEADVNLMVLPGAALSDFPRMQQLAARFPENVRMAMGLHPTELTPNPAEALARVEEQLNLHPEAYVAVGEAGVDLYCPGPPADVQQQAFDAQCRLALDRRLPVIIHCRDGLDQVLEVLEGLPQVPQAVFHCFGGSADDVERIRRVGDFYFGIGGVVTFKNSRLRFTLPEITLDRILLETDAPYLAPTPHRGTRNESAHIPLIANAVAQALATPLPLVASATTASARRFFRLP